MANQPSEFHPNQNEYFPPREPLGSASGSAELKALLMKMATATLALAAATIFLLGVSVELTPMEIWNTSAVVEAKVTQRDENMNLYWVLVPYQEEVDLEHTDSVGNNFGMLEEDLQLLRLQDLETNTWYTLFVFGEDENGQLKPLERLDFKTGDDPLSHSPSPTPRPTPSVPPQVTPGEIVTPTPTPSESQEPSETPTPSESPEPDPTPPPTPYFVPPSAQTPQIRDYVFNEETWIGSYNVVFRFDLNDADITSIEIIGTMTPENPFDSTAEVPVPVNLSYATGDSNIIIIDNNIAEVVVPVEDAYQNVELRAILNFTITNPDTGELWESSNVSSESFFAEPTYLIGLETNSTNTIEAVVNNDQVDLTLTFNDFHQGTFDFQVESMEVYVYYDSNIEPIVVPIENNPVVENGQIVHQFSIPRENSETLLPADSIYVRADISGDSLINGTKMMYVTDSFIAQEIVIGTGYALPEIPIDTTDPKMTIHGLTVSSITYYTDSGSYGTSIPKVIPGREVYVNVEFTGAATQDFILVPEIQINEMKLTLVSPIPTQVDVYTEGVPYLEFSFIMPEEDVMIEDLVVIGISELVTP